jgi:hypothetical protein
MSQKLTGDYGIMVRVKDLEKNKEDEEYEYRCEISQISTE